MGRPQAGEKGELPSVAVSMVFLNNYKAVLNRGSFFCVGEDCFRGVGADNVLFYGNNITGFLTDTTGFLTDTTITLMSCGSGVVLDYVCVSCFL